MSAGAFDSVHLLEADRTNTHTHTHTHTWTLSLGGVASCLLHSLAETLAGTLG